MISNCDNCQKKLLGTTSQKVGESILCESCFREFQETLFQIKSEKLWDSIREESSYDVPKFFEDSSEDFKETSPSNDAEILAQIGLEESGLVVLKGFQERYIGRMIQDVGAQCEHLLQKRLEDKKKGILKCELKLMQLLLKGRYATTENLVQGKIYQEKNKISYCQALSQLGLLGDREIAMILCEETGILLSTRELQKPEASLANLLPMKVMEIFQMLPMARKDNTLSLAMVNPFDDEFPSTLSRILSLSIIPVIITERCLNQSLKEWKVS